MSVQLSRREVEGLRPSLERAIHRALGHSDSALLSTASSCLTNGYDHRKIVDKLSSHIDSNKAKSLAEKILDLVEDVTAAQRSSSKRSHDYDDEDKESVKKSRKEDVSKYDETSSKYDDRGSKYDDTSTKYNEQSFKYDDASLKYDDRGSKYDDRSLNYNDKSPEYSEKGSKYDEKNYKYDDDKVSKYDVRTSKYDDRTSKYDDKSAKYDDKSYKYDDKSLKYDDRSSKYEDKSTKYDNRGSKYDDKYSRHDDKNTKYDDKTFKVDEKTSKYDDRGSKYEEKSSKLEDKNSKYDDKTSKYDDRSTKYDDKNSKYDDKTSKYDDKNSKYDDKTSKYDDKNSKYDDKTSKYDDRSSKYEDKSYKYDDKNSKYDDKNSKYDDKTSKYDDRSTKYDDKNSKYDDKKTKYDDKGSKYDEKKSRYDDKTSKYDDRSSKYDAKTSKYDDDRAAKYDERGDKSKHTEDGSSKNESRSAKSTNETDKEQNNKGASSVEGDAGADGESMTGLSADRIRLMMENAQREIQERKKALSVLKGEQPENRSKVNQAAVSAAMAAAAQIRAHIATAPITIVQSKSEAIKEKEDNEKQRKIAELQARIQMKLAGGLAGAGGERPAPLILDDDGRTVDAGGKQVTLTHIAHTLKANIHAKRREEFRQQLASEKADEPQDSRFYDDRVTAKPAQRLKRALKFHEPGKFQQLAERIRMKAQLEKLQNEISQIARKTGIQSATKLALLAPHVSDTQRVPNIEWWDSVILLGSEDRASDSDSDSNSGEKTRDHDICKDLNLSAVTNLVEHPQQMKPPTEPLKPVLMPVFLTARERKKLRRQNRREAYKEEQEKVRLGLEAPAEPKLRISNLMRALGTEAVQDPTKVEAHVREQMAKRQKKHAAANAARALSGEQRKEKAHRKMLEDTSLGVHVALYRICDLFECASKKFKVETNAQQLHMTGLVLLHRGCCVVVVEGGPRQHAKYKRLMLHRIKWEEDQVKDAEGREVRNSCQLVWEGTTKTRNFGDIKFKICPTEKLAREHFLKHKVPQYWDLAYSGAVLEQSET